MLQGIFCQVGLRFSETRSTRPKQVQLVLLHAFTSSSPHSAYPRNFPLTGAPSSPPSVTTDFLSRWNVRRRMSSAYFPQSNKRAKVAVKTAKRIPMSSIGPTGSLNNDNLLLTMLQLRNTPDPDYNVSPANVLFGKPLRDAFAFINRIPKFDNPSICPLWREAKTKEDALRTRFTRTSASLNEHTRLLPPPLSQGDMI